MYPFKKREYYLNTRGAIQNNIELMLYLLRSLLKEMPYGCTGGFEGGQTVVY